MQNRTRHFAAFCLASVMSLLVGGPSTDANADTPFITVASTTSTANSGLFDFLLPRFEAEHDMQVRIVAVGTGKAIRLAQNGDADVLFVHHTPSEEKFVSDGYGRTRFDVMYNDFVLIGPADDPANIADATTATQALNRIYQTRQPFASRGDNSGTHKKELALWQATTLNPAGASGTWYRETGSGMGATLNVASGMNAYALTDRATWLKFANKGELQILLEGDPTLFNQYGIIVVDAQKHPHVKTELAEAFSGWLRGEAGQTLINRYRINGTQAFFANAKP